MSGGGNRYVQYGLIGALVVILGTAVIATALDTSDGFSPGGNGNGGDGTPGGFPTEEPTTAEQTPDPTPEPTPEPTPTPTPTPVPLPDVLEGCHDERPAIEEGISLLPASEGSMFQGCQLVAFYGHPFSDQMGELGVGDPASMIGRLKAMAAEYEASNGGRQVVPTLHLITSVAQRSAGPDGTYLARMEHELIEEWIGYAEEHDLLILLDMQVGHGTIEDEFEHVADYLSNPRVHLAYDPEWAMAGTGQAPAAAVGHMTAEQINWIQHAFQDVVDEYNLENQMLMIHQFQDQMIRDKEQLEDLPGVDLVIHTDGFGTRHNKIEAYNRYVRDDDVQHSGFKLFFDWDVDLMEPADVNRLDPQPDVVTYQ